MDVIWTGEFGNEYTQRNRVDTVDARAQMWRVLLPRDCHSVLEVGANVGQNLEAISRIRDCEMYACEPNELAREELSGIVHPPNITSDLAHKLRFPDKVVDLVFSCGVLIHIPTDKLLASAKEMHRCARRWIIVGEYFAPSEEMIPYRGQRDMLWRRDYGSLFLDNFSDLHCYGTMFAWKRMTGLDNLTFWIFEKGQRRH